jgi:hypothetical protein
MSRKTGPVYSRAGSSADHAHCLRYQYDADELVC